MTKESKDVPTVVEPTVVEPTVVEPTDGVVPNAPPQTTISQGKMPKAKVDPRKSVRYAYRSDLSNVNGAE